MLQDQRALASALYYMGDIYIAMQDDQQAKVVLEESISICWSIHFPQQLNMAMTSLGRAWEESGDRERALATTREALAIAEQIEDVWGMIHALQSLGTINRFAREYDLAIDYFERSLPQIRLIGDRFAEGITLANLSILHHLKENHPASGHAVEKAFAVFQAIGDEVQQPFPLRMMAYSAIHAGNIVRARALIVESFKGNLSLGHVPGQLACIVAWATCESVEGKIEKAITLAAAVEHYLLTRPYELMEPDQTAIDRLLTTGRNTLSTRDLEKATMNGQKLMIEDILAQELRVLS